MSAYNYDHFTSTDYDFTSFAGPGRSEPMPAMTLETIDGSARSLADYRGRTLVLETGSVTCPMYAKGVPGMADLVARHPDVAFVLLYVREAHPGGRVGPHRNTAEKRAAGRMVSAVHHDRREVLLDDLDGTAHRMLGAFPNMVYVVDPDGVVAFRGDWTDVDAVTAVLAGTADEEQLRTQHYPPAKPGPRTALRTLLIGGGRAVFDFVVGLPGLLWMHRRADRHYATVDSPADSTTTVG